VFIKNKFQRKKMNIYKLFLFSVNISLIFCSELIQECEILKNYTNFDDIQCCKLSYVKCNESEGHIVSM